MDLHLPTHGISWNSIFWRFVKFHGYPCPYCWNSMEFQLLMIREIPWNSRQGKLKIHGIPGFINSWRSMYFQTRINGNPWNSRFYQFVEIHGIPECILLTCSKSKVVKKEEDMIKCVLLLERLLRRTGREVEEEEPEQRQKEQRQEEERQEAPDKVV